MNIPQEQAPAATLIPRTSMDWAFNLFPIGAIAGVAWSLAAFSGLWALSLKRNNTNYVDMYWGSGFLVLSLMYSWLAHWKLGGLIGGGSSWFSLTSHPASELLLLTLVTVWGIRLSAYIIWRNRVRWGGKEDPRYARMRADALANGDDWKWASLRDIFVPQVIVQATVSLCLWVAILAAHQRQLELNLDQAASTSVGIQQKLLFNLSSLTFLDGVAFLVWGIGFAMETMADVQKAIFKSKRGNEDKIFMRGLFSISRHPNHFGDALQWWGFWIMSLNLFLTTAGIWEGFRMRMWGAFLMPALALLCPVVMTAMLRYWTGAELLESDIQSKRPEYKEWVKRVPVFVPKLPQRWSQIFEIMPRPTPTTYVYTG